MELNTWDLVVVNIQTESGQNTEMMELSTVTV